MSTVLSCFSTKGNCASHNSAFHMSKLVAVHFKHRSPSGRSPSDAAVFYIGSKTRVTAEKTRPRGPAAFSGVGANECETGGDIAMVRLDGEIVPQPWRTFIWAFACGASALDVPTSRTRDRCTFVRRQDFDHNPPLHHQRMTGRDLQIHVSNARPFRYVAGYAFGFNPPCAQAG
jgi:hypothetical protein